MAVEINESTGDICFQDMGVTVRTLLGFAAKGYANTNRRKWVLRYNGTIIGELQVRTTDKKVKKDDSNAGSVQKRKATKQVPGANRAAQDNSSGESVAVGAGSPTQDKRRVRQSAGGVIGPDVVVPVGSGDGVDRDSTKSTDGAGCSGVLGQPKDGRGVRAMARKRKAEAQGTTGASSHDTSADAAGAAEPCGGAPRPHSEGTAGGATGGHAANPTLPAESDHAGEP